MKHVIYIIEELVITTARNMYWNGYLSLDKENYIRPSAEEISNKVMDRIKHKMIRTRSKDTITSKNKLIDMICDEFKIVENSLR